MPLPLITPPVEWLAGEVISNRLQWAMGLLKTRRQMDGESRHQQSFTFTPPSGLINYTLKSVSWSSVWRLVGGHSSVAITAPSLRVDVRQSRKLSIRIWRAKWKVAQS